MSYILCFVEFSKLKYSDYNLIDGNGEFCVKKELLRLDFVVKPTSKHICKQCLRLVKRRQASRKKLKEIDNELFSKYKTAASKNGITVKPKSSKPALFDDGVAEIQDAESFEVGDEDESSTTRWRPIVPNFKTKMAGSTPAASKETNASENVQAFIITSPPLFSPMRTASVTSVLTESKLRQESTNSSVVFMSDEKSMNIIDFNNIDLMASTPRPVVVIKGKKSTTVYNDTESHTAANISTNHTACLNSHLNQSIVNQQVSRYTQTSNKTIQPHDTSLATTAHVKVVWKSQTREKVLPPDLTSVGATLCRGTYKQIASSV